jgi:PAS domain S-box-containing protein
MLADISHRRGAGYWAAILGVAVVTAVFAPLHAALSTTTVALAYLLVVLFVATVWGRLPAMVASVLAMLCFNFFFLPPIYTFTIADSQNWVALTAFLVTAITAGHLSERAKRRAAAAEAARSASAYNRSLIEASLDPLVTIGADGRIIDVNTATEAVTGRPRDELIGTDFSGYFTEPERARAGYEQAWRAGLVRDHALELRHRDGHSTSVLYNASVYRDDRGLAIGVVAAVRPIRTSAGQPARALSDPDVVRGLSRFVSFTSVLSAAVGVLGLAGWMFHIPVFKSVIPGQVVIKPNTTVCFVLIGLSLWLMRRVDDHPVPGAWKLGGQLLAAVVAAVGLLSLTEHVVGWDLGIDQLLFQETAADAIGSLRPGLMAPITALDFLLLGLALVGLDWTISWRSRRYSPAQVLATVAGLASIVGLLDFVLKSAISYTHIALQTAVALCLLSLAVVCARTERGVPSLFVSGSVGGTLVRRLLPAAIVIPVLIGALSWIAMSAGFSSVWSGGTLMIVAMIALLGNLTVLVGFLIDRADVERRRAEGTLLRREEELREAQRLARVGSWWWDPRIDKVTWSEELCRIVGRDPKLPPPGYHEHARFYTAESFVRLDAAVQHALRTGTPYELDLDMVTAGGALRSVTGRGEVERDADGHVVLVRGTVHDITERKQAEEALQRSADEVRDLYNHAPCGYHSLDANGVFVRINDTELEWLRYARADLIGKMKLPDLLAPGSLPTFEAEFPRLKTEGAVRDLEFDLVRRDGTILPVLISATAITDPDGKYLMSRSMVYDMTERKRAEEALRLASAYNRSLIEAALDPLVTIGPDGRITDVNAATEAATGHPRAALIGTDFSDYFTDPEKARAGYRQVFHEGFVRDYALELRHRDGHLASVLYNAAVYRDSGGRVIGVFAAARDITARKQAEEALRESEANLNRAQEIAHLGSWHLDVARDRLTWSDEVCRIFGVPRGTALTYEAFLGAVHPEDREGVDQAWAAALRGAPYDIEHRIVVGVEPKWVRERAQVEFDTDSRAVRGIGTVQDITERKRAEDEIRRLARLQAEAAELGQDALRGAPLQAVLDGAVTRVARALGVDYCNVAEMLPGGDEFLLRAGAGWKEGVVGRATVKSRGSQPGYTILGGRPVIIEDAATETRFAPLPRLLGEEVVSAMSVVISTAEGPYGVLGAHSRRRRVFTRDEVNFLQAVANVLGTAIARQRAEEQLRRVNRAHRALSTCNQALVRATDESALLRQICRIIVEEAGYRLCWVGYAEEDAARTVRPVAQAGFDEGYLEVAKVTWADTERGRGPMGTCIRTGEIQVVKNIATDPRLAPWRADALQRGYASSIAIPLGAADRPFGALTIYSSEIEAFGDEEVRLLTELANDLGYGIVSLRTQAERKRAEAEEAAREREVAIGFRIQRMLLLDEPPRDIPGLRVAALTIPSQRIAGDFYEFFTHQDESLDVIVADVMGKGIPAALLGAATKSHFTEALCHLMALSPAGVLPEPREVVTLAHADMARHLIELESFVTLCYARVDLTRRRLALVDCGHTGLIHVRGGTDLCEMVHGDNLPLGIREGEIYDQIAVPFEAGDVFLFYSDGITEASNATGERFGTDRLMASVRMNGNLAPDALLGAVRAAVLAFAGSDRLTDDLTCVAVEVGERRRPLARREMEIRSDLRDLSRAREFVRTFCRTLPGSPLDEDRVAELALAVNEAASNVMKHAYHGRTDQRIHLEAEAFADHVAVRLHHLGDPFDPSAVPLPSFDGSRESGFGIYLITRSVDDVRYYRDERGGNCIALVKMRQS